MNPNDRVLQSEFIPTQSLGIRVDTLLQSVAMHRRNFERKWYDNNFFDDGFHFRYVSRTTGKIIDGADRSNVNLPTRAIPKASRQIRGVANLLLQPDFVPVVYPEKVTQINYPDPQMYTAALNQAKSTAQKIGHWMTEEWKNQHLKEKLMHMVILAAKHGVSYLQVWPDAVEEKIRTEVFDAFDIYLMGNINSIYDSPFIIKAVPQLISNIKANENFDREQLLKITPDNKYASSEIKNAYMLARYGTGMTSDTGATLILKELFMKEYINERNMENIQKLSKPGVLEGKKQGDMVMRHAFVAGGLPLMDEYIDLPDYPFVDFRMEPGAMYQTPLIERFIPLNKSMDIIMSRVERYINTMTAGTWLKRKGENYEITNIPGGQTLEYTGSKPEQAAMAPMPSHVFNALALMEKWIGEQGAETSALGQIPDGVKSGRAIESVKATEYANLKIPSNQLKESVRRISEKMLDIASNHFVTPQTVYLLEEGEPSYFDIIGQAGIDARIKLNQQAPGTVPIPQAIPIKKDYRVDIQVESGLGFTEEGKKETMQQIIAFLLQLQAAGLINPEAMKIAVGNFLKTYNFGATQDFLTALEEGGVTANLSEDQITQMKIAVAEAMQDLGVAGEDKQEEMIMTTKVGVVEALKETGMLNALNKPEETKSPADTINYKDTPEDVKRQLEAQAGLKPSTLPPPKPTSSPNKS